MNFLEARGYFPALVHGGKSSGLTLANCPYLEAARDTRALCEFDRALVGELFGQRVRLAGRIVDRDPVCTFTLPKGALASAR